MERRKSGKAAQLGCQGSGSRMHCTLSEQHTNTTLATITHHHHEGCLRNAHFVALAALV